MLPTKIFPEKAILQVLKLRSVDYLAFSNSIDWLTDWLTDWQLKLHFYTESHLSALSSTDQNLPQKAVL